MQRPETFSDMVQRRLYIVQMVVFFSRTCPAVLWLRLHIVLMVLFFQGRVRARLRPDVLVLTRRGTRTLLYKTKKRLRWLIQAWAIVYLHWRVRVVSSE